MIKQKFYRKKYIPLTRSKIASQIFRKEIFYKHEHLNPTGSHKDRECEYILKKKQNQAFNSVGCASTGNLAISLAYYAKKFNKKCHIWVKKNISKKKIKILKKYNPNIYFKKQNLLELYDSSNKIMKKNNILNLNPKINKDKIIANKSIGKEILAQNKDIDLFVCTINNGSLFLGLYEYIKRFKNKSLIGVYTYSRKALSINGFNLYEDKNLISKFKNNNNIFLIKIDDKQIRNNQHILSKEKLNLEYDCATMLAVLKKKNIEKYKNICCILSGKKR